MSDSDTYLDEILDGVIDVSQARIRPDQASAVAPPPSEIDESKTRTTPKETGVDGLLEGLNYPTPPSRTEPGAPPAPTALTDVSHEPAAIEPTAIGPEIRQPDADGPKSAVTAFAVTDVGATPAPTEPAISSVDLPVVSPHEILGLPGQTDASTTHFDLAQEVNDVSATEPVTESREPPSFAAIAQEIAATVDESGTRSKSTSQTSEEQEEADRSNLYLRSSGRRRRRRVNRMAFGQVIAIVLLLVVGLAGEWEYVSRGQTSSSSNTPVATVPRAVAVRLPTVNSTRVAGTLFAFETSGSAQSAPFRMTKPFAVAWTARCSQLSKPSSVQVLFQAAGRTALNIVLGATSHTARGGTSATLRPGVYAVVAHAPGACTWKAQGVPRT